MDQRRASLFRARNAATRIMAHDKGISLMQSLSDMLRENVTYYSWIGFYMLRDGKLHLDAWAGAQATEHTVIEVGQGICGAAVKDRTTIVVDDVASDPRYLACFASTRSEIVVPIFKDGQVIGEIDVDGELSGAFDHNDREFLEWIASEAADRL